MKGRPLNPISRVVRAYGSPVVRAYCAVRFVILRQRFLDEIGQYLPERGRVLDVGCGFGLFSLYFAQLNPKLEIDGIDLNERRIQMAHMAASKLGIPNVTYMVANAEEFQPGRRYSAIYMLDIIHHISVSTVRGLIEDLYSSLDAGGVLLIKDVAYSPAVKRWFTFWLDKLMDPRAPVNYWRIAEVVSMLRDAGFRSYTHQMVDILPYPHVLYICHKDA